MGFGDLKLRLGLEVLNKYFEDKSYIEGWVFLIYMCLCVWKMLKIKVISVLIYLCVWF